VPAKKLRDTPYLLAFLIHLVVVFIIGIKGIFWKPFLTTLIDEGGIYWRCSTGILLCRYVNGEGGGGVMMRQEMNANVWIWIYNVP